uniref:Uncharacterized membrane protein YqiK, contains Band7/PHB/SPFH domain n=1 Tax=Candidatus Kentrum eta TaxID=2126337 RepID=A0A450VAD6_9GAMM|nr:MAG: Uncharacterized membrane protein YqiK, contains Band7/PHB/SPFH domain [Candidatus Kentron sp. H]VFJ95167.1 MAG: Uncharacterized membrane protein YqiK, contains Band7/PHB/SPFH domain [Candidatus Kentron sp. H]VFK01737.1 MAG: Uncharacterized membrane protein YqiK, contains Band7/PHB/SPFH domain [Candidatus Kentron sp. H]
MWSEIISYLIFALAIVLVSFVVFIIKNYRVIGANEVGIISGIFRRQRIPETGKIRNYTLLTGGGVLVWPVINQLNILSLALREIKIDLDVRTKEYLPLKLTVVLVFHIDGHGDRLHVAVSLFTQRTDPDDQFVEDLLMGSLRDVIAGMSYHELHRERGRLEEETQGFVQGRFDELGLKVTSLVIQNLTPKEIPQDKDDFWAVKAREAMAEIMRETDSNIAQQDSLKESALAKADAEKAINVFNSRRDEFIAAAETRKEQEISQRNLDRDVFINGQKAQESEESQKKETERNIGIVEQETRKAMEIAKREAARDIRIKDEEALRDEVCKEQERIEETKLKKESTRAESEVAKVRADKQIKLETEDARKLESLRENEITREIDTNRAAIQQDIGVARRDAERQIKVASINAARDERLREQETEREIVENKKELLKTRDEMKAIEFDTNVRSHRAELVPPVLAEKEQQETQANIKKAVLVIESLARLSAAENDRNAKAFEAEGNLRLVQAEAEG